MRGEIVARNYADALFAIADRDGRLEDYGRALDEVARLLDESPDVRLFLETPRIDPGQKKRVMRDAFEGRVPAHVLHFLLLVVDKRRQELLRGMARAYRDLVDERMGRTHVDVSVARPMDDEETSEVARRLSTILETQAVPHVRVDPGLIGGIVFRSGDTIFDGSVRRRLQRMRRQLLASDLSTT